MPAPATVAGLLARLDGVRPAGDRRWRALCSAHEDHDPSLSVGEGDDGRVLLHCHAGCTVDAIAAGLGLGVAQLFPLPAPRGRSRPPPAPRPKAVPSRPAGVVGSWAGCLPVTDDPAVACYLAGRGLDPGDVMDRDLARALAGPLSPWMWCRTRSWPAGGYRVVLPLYGATGRLESIHARAVDPATDPKAAFPAGASPAGLVLADAGARCMLRGEFQPVALVVAEGVPDFLTWATTWSDADEAAPAVLGVLAGSWSDALAARVPDGIPVYIRTHADGAGEKYANEIHRTLAGRCRVFRREVTP